MKTLHGRLGALRSSAARLGRLRMAGSVDGLPLALVTTRGRYSGKHGTVPLLYVEDGDGIALAASHAGSNVHPAWYHNLVAEPEVTVEVGGARKQMRASLASEPDRTRIYEAFKRRSTRYARYEARSARTIPVVRLHEPAGAA